MTRAEMMGRMSGRELLEWAAFEALEPFGGPRGDIQAAIVASTMANIYRPKGRRAYGLEQFIPRFERPAGPARPERPERPKQTWQEQLSLVEALNQAFGGLDLRGKNGNANHVNG